MMCESAACHVGVGVCAIRLVCVGAWEDGKMCGVCSG